MEATFRFGSSQRCLGRDAAQLHLQSQEIGAEEELVAARNAHSS